MTSIPSCVRLLILSALILIGGRARPRVEWQGDTGRTSLERKASAFLLGWDSKLLIVERTQSGRQEYLSNIKRQLHELGLAPKHPTEYYFQYPIKDGGLRAQEFSDEVMAQLRKSDSDVANHFAVAHNLLLTIAHTETPEVTRRAEIAELVTFLDLPDDLKKMPAADLMNWIGDIHDYFAATARQQQRAAEADSAAEALSQPQENLFENPDVNAVRLRTCFHQNARRQRQNSRSVLARLFVTGNVDRRAVRSSHSMGRGNSCVLNLNGATIADGSQELWQDRHIANPNSRESEFGVGSEGEDGGPLKYRYSRVSRPRVFSTEHAMHWVLTNRPDYYQRLSVCVNVPYCATP
jgi:hypothetical protein